MTITPTVVGATTAFITFTPSSKVVTWHTYSNTQAGTYMIMIVGEIGMQFA
jgi:hypothetical protein